MIFKSKLPDIEIPTSGIFQFIARNPNKVPDDKVAFIDVVTGRKLTFGEVKRNSEKFAAGLINKFKFKRGDVLAIISPNEFDYSVVLLGAIAAGGIATTANPSCTADELACQLTDSGASVIVAHPLHLHTVKAAAAKVKIPDSNVLLFGDTVIDGFQPFITSLILNNEQIGNGFKPVEYTSEEVKSTPAFYCYSSGTTGKQKGVILTHTNIVANVTQIAAFEDSLDSKSIFTGVLPFYHIYGLTLKLVGIHLGASTVSFPKFELSKFCRAIQDYKIDYAYVAPPVVLKLAKDPIVDKYDLSSLKMVVSGAAPLSKELSIKFYERLKVPIKQGYGLTETSPVVTLGDRKKIVLGSAGILVPNVEAKLLSSDGKELGYNEPGELCVRGPNIMRGYLNNKEATNASIDKDGFYHTGDVSIVDENGNYFIVDRVKELIKYKGFQVAPAELEAILLTHSAVADAAVIGVEFEEGTTEYPVAYVATQAGYEQTPQLSSEIQKFVEVRVAPHKKIRMIIFTAEIPKSASGKILRKNLRERVRKRVRRVNAKL